MLKPHASRALAPPAPPPTHQPPARPPPPPGQVYYPVPNEVYRDEWDDVQVTDPMEFTHCRYTPVVTEVGPSGCRARGRRGRCWLVALQS